MWIVFSRFFVGALIEALMFGGGESQRTKALLCWGYSRKAQCIGNQASVKPITRGETGHSQSSRFYKNPLRGEVTIGAFPSH